MKIPRDVSGHDLVNALKFYDYFVSRQTGSHLRLTSSKMGYDHHITVPNHEILKIGTLNAILISVATYLKLSRKQVNKDISFD